MNSKSSARSQGDLDTWFALLAKHAHKWNHADRRNSARIPGSTRAVGIIEQIHRSRDRGSAGLRESREALDGIVQAARDAFMSVELDKFIGEAGTEMLSKATDDEREWHAELIAASRQVRPPSSVETAHSLALLK
jgi:hypothetical protein